MRSYGQKCGLAKALDLVGDRWTLLIIRELLIRGACRYTDIREGLPGIATNLLADRLGELEEAGVVVRREPQPPVATALFELTARGKALEPAIMQLGLWGAPMLKDAPKGEVLQPHWMVLPLRHYLKDRRPDEPGVEIEIRAGREVIAVAARNGAVDVRLGAASDPKTTVSGKPEFILHLFAGRMDVRAAVAAGVEIRGPREPLSRVIGFERI